MSLPFKIEEITAQPGAELTWQLIRYAQLAPSREWLEGYLDLMQFLIKELHLQNDDPRLVTSMRKGSWYFPFSVNNRYVLVCKRKREQVIEGIILGSEFGRNRDAQPDVVKTYSFDPLRGENVVETPYLVFFKNTQTILEQSNAKESWLSAARLETKRATGSPYRRFHQPLIYKLASDLNYRQTILNEAF